MTTQCKFDHTLFCCLQDIVYMLCWSVAPSFSHAYLLTLKHKADIKFLSAHGHSYITERYFNPLPDLTQVL